MNIRVLMMTTSISHAKLWDRRGYCIPVKHRKWRERRRNRQMTFQSNSSFLLILVYWWKVSILFLLSFRDLHLLFLLSFHSLVMDTILFLSKILWLIHSNSFSLFDWRYPVVQGRSAWFSFLWKKDLLGDGLFLTEREGNWGRMEFGETCNPFSNCLLVVFLDSDIDKMHP